MIEEIQESLLPLRRQIIEHPLFQKIETAGHLATFMEYHVFAVWDFMSLLKALQIHLTCVSLPWAPKGDSFSRRMIQEIVLGEESDEHPDGGYVSHFEWYCQAMAHVGADQTSIQSFVKGIQKGKDVENLLRECHAPEGVRPFVHWTLETCRKKPHQVASAFTFGREELVPDLFRSVVQGLEGRFPERILLFRKYLDRHIDLDEGTHTPLAFKMLNSLCGHESRKWEEVKNTAHEALAQRKRLWDAILAAIDSNY